jgi:hypothetical protein
MPVPASTMAPAVVAMGSARERPEVASAGGSTVGLLLDASPVGALGGTTAGAIGAIVAVGATRSRLTSTAVVTFSGTCTLRVNALYPGARAVTV